MIRGRWVAPDAAVPAEERLANDPTSELWGEHRARYRFALGRLVGGPVLDVACGAGFGLAMLRQAGLHALGADLDAAALIEVRQAHGAVPLVRADAAHLPLPDASMAAVVSFETIEHVPDAEGLLRDVARVLRRDGQLVLSTPNRLFGPAWLHANNPFHVREFAGDELAELLRAHFGDVVVYGQYVSPHYRHVPFLMVERRNRPDELAWKLLNRLPFAAKDRLARALGGRGFYPGETDYVFRPHEWWDAHALVAVARRPRD